MLSLNVRSAQFRRACLVVAIAACCAAASRATAQQAAADPLKFTSAESVILLNLIKPDKAADFETAWKDIKAKLSSQTAKPELQALSEHLRIVKVDLPPDPATGVTYVFICDPVSKTQSYSPTALLFESGAFTREEADAIYAKLKDCYNRIVPWPIVKVG
ncbi:MAG TPA: hypothetical protein VLT86_12720 [Vicinamibacterales bacterium]|nr:hypothetical protein [Vicinamibacterales bacterium]